MNNVKTFPLLENIRNAFLREIQSTEKYNPDQGKKYGKSLRTTISRTHHGQWPFRAHRIDKIQLIFDQERNRVQDIVPLRHERMKASTFAFLRGAAIVMASDMSELSSTNIRVQACGDAHIANFGIFTSPERHLVFDLTDFDETLPAPWEWDIKRMVASMEVCGRDRGFTSELRSQAIQLAIKTYQDSMHQYASMSPLAV